MKKIYRTLLICILAFLFIGCAPKGGEYYKITSSYKSEYFRTSCHGSIGAPSIAFIKYNQIYISSRIEKNKLFIGIHVPKGYNVKLVDKKVKYIRNDNSFKSLILAPIKHYPRGSSYPYVFLKSDPFGKEDYFKTLVGDTNYTSWKLFTGKIEQYKWYQFYTNISVVESGKIILPSLIINGRIFDGIILNFDRDFYFQPIASLNC